MVWRSRIVHICGKELSSDASLKVHVDRHKPVKDIMCNVCGKLFTVRADLNTHMKYHLDEKPLSCASNSNMCIFSAHCRIIWKFKSNIFKLYDNLQQIYWPTYNKFYTCIIIQLMFSILT